MWDYKYMEERGYKLPSNNQLILSTMTLQERRQLAKKRLANPALYVKQIPAKVDQRADNQADKMIDRGLIAWW